MSAATAEQDKAAAVRSAAVEPSIFRLRAHGRLALSALPAQGSVHFGDRRLFLHRHHARRRDADHRHGGDERFSHRTDLAHPRHQRPHDRPAARRAARQLCGPCDEVCRRQGRDHGDPDDRGADACLGAGRAPAPALWCAACAADDLDQDEIDFRPYPVRRSRRLCRRNRRCDRLAHGRAARHRRRRRPSRWSSPEGDVTPMGVNPRVKSYTGLGDLRDRHVGIRCLDHLHAARGGAALFQCRRHRPVDRALRRQSRLVDDSAPADRGRRPAGRS